MERILETAGLNLLKFSSADLLTVLKPVFFYVIDTFWLQTTRQAYLVFLNLRVELWIVHFSENYTNKVKL
jgi:hypothetical protein